MTNTNNATSGEQNLDHLEALATIRKFWRGYCWQAVTREECAQIETALAALARRAAPVSAPIAGDVQFIKTWQMRAAEAHGMRWQSAWNLEQHMYAEIADLRAALANLRKQVDAALERELAHYAATTERQLAELDALANQPAPTCVHNFLNMGDGLFRRCTKCEELEAPTAAPEQVTHGADERALFEDYARRAPLPLDGHGGHYSNIRTRNNWMGWQARAALSQPSEAAPLAACLNALRTARHISGVVQQRDDIKLAIEKAQVALDAAPSLPAALDWPHAPGRDGVEAPPKPAPAAGDELDALRHRYIRMTTTAVRDPATGERIEVTPEMYDAAIDRAMLNDPEWSKGIKSEHLIAHQPAQEQAEPQKGAVTDYGTPAEAAQHEASDRRSERAVDALDGMGFVYDEEIGWLPPKHQADSPVVRAQSEESAVDKIDVCNRVLEWNRASDDPSIKITREYEVAKKVIELYDAALQAAGAQQSHAGADEADAKRFVVFVDSVLQMERGFEHLSDLSAAVCEEMMERKPRTIDEVRAAVDAAIRAAQEGESNENR